jgi:hypothetical protein
MDLVVSVHANQATTAICQSRRSWDARPTKISEHAESGKSATLGVPLTTGIDGG